MESCYTPMGVATFDARRLNKRSYGPALLILMVMVLVRYRTDSFEIEIYVVILPAVNLTKFRQSPNGLFHPSYRYRESAVRP